MLERGLLLKMRFALDHHVNLRPSKLYPTASSPLAEPGDIDFVVVREGTEGLYCGNGGTLREELSTRWPARYRKILVSVWSVWCAMRLLGQRSAASF